MRSKGRIDILKPSSNDGTIVSGFEKLSIYKENDGSHNGLSVTHGSGVVAKVWDSENDGPGSGLNADLLDGWHITQLASTHIHNELQWRLQTGYAGIEITGYKIVMLSANTNKFEPLTIGDTTNTTKTVNPKKFLLNSPILFNIDSSIVAADTLLGSSFYIYGITRQLAYTSNSTGLNNGQPLYLKGKVNDSVNSSYLDGSFQLDNTTLTSWLTQALPTSNDGFVYILLGIVNSGELVMLPYHPIYKYTPNGIRIYTPGGLGSGNDADLIWGTDAKTFVEDVINLNTNVAKYPNGLSFNPQNSRTFDFSSNNYYDGTAYTLVGGSATYTIANPILGKIMYAALPPKPTNFNITFTPNVTVIGTPSSVAGKTNLIRITCINATAPKYIAEILVH